VLAAFILLYLAASLGVGLYAATRVRGAADYAVAGRRFGTPVVAATVFATWFGAESVLGIPATFLKEGLRGVVADPFAAFACLVLVALVFARPLHRLDVLTLGDFFRARFGRTAEVVLSLCIAFSYLGWIAAQLVAFGLAASVVTGGALDARAGIVIAALLVVAGTWAGGMWSVALTDYFQAAMIVIGMAYVAWVVADLAGGVARVAEVAGASGRMAFLPEAGAKPVLAWISAALVVVLGSVPQQDVLQRVKSARDEAVAVRATLLGAGAYFAIAAIPVFLACAAQAIDPAMVARMIDADFQRILPTLILERTPLLAQVLFFGALVSAILSTASGALLAPAVALAENVVRPLRGGRGARDSLGTMRLAVVVVGIAVTAMALTSTRSIYQLVNESGKVVLVACFVPLAAGLFWKRANALGAHASIVLGLAAWIALELVAPGATVPPPLAGLLASTAGMLAGSWWGSRPHA
jgi:SSS family solute:Na+ symporter